MMSPVLPIVSVSMAESLKKLEFSDVTPFCYKDGDLTEYQENLLAPLFRRYKLGLAAEREWMCWCIVKCSSTRLASSMLSSSTVKTARCARQPNARHTIRLSKLG